MASYSELFDLKSNTDLRNKVAVAVQVSAQAIMIESPPVEKRARWAQRAIDNPIDEAVKVFALVLAANKDATVSQIESAADSAIQANVDAVVDGLIEAQATLPGGVV